MRMLVRGHTANKYLRIPRKLPWFMRQLVDETVIASVGKRSEVAKKKNTATQTTLFSHRLHGRPSSYSPRSRCGVMPIVGGIDLIAGTIAAFSALLVYDVFFVTFYKEVLLIWPSRWNFVKILFFLNRYLPFVDTFLSLHLLTGKSTDRGCLLGFQTVTWLIVIGIIISEMILMVRTYAIWGQNRIILYILIFMSAGVFIPGIIVTQFEVQSFAYVAMPRGCSQSKPASSIIFVAFLLLILCETTIVAMTLIRARQHYISREIRSPLIKQLYKDGLFYYVYLLTFSIVNVITALAAPPAFANWLTTPQRVVHSLLCTRVLLHIRSHNTTPDTELMTTQVDMSFVTPLEYNTQPEPLGLSSGTASGSGYGSSSASDSYDTRVFLSFASHTDSTSPSEGRSSVVRYKNPEIIRERDQDRGYEAEAEAYELQPLSRRSRTARTPAQALTPSPTQTKFDSRTVESPTSPSSTHSGHFSPSSSSRTSYRKGKQRETEGGLEERLEEVENERDR
ncbi:uncharacterized protein FOMMEDRAFT_169913 [Fomitiporia mediterranea MF3/22]|uniref:uncharacterized protein n=1 Tax=Fomitiporia mediterranea (strain MF3/22) TaxID=694068 RepID=UPI00044094E7|nr:uncharacterized protein FOMMEDRAFT_169913 [Fomitiporia mediterranea MF3/22]EJD00468.1 hypothetical protein FOMMEDRAFT_169913 [Fomitiporia mediterranea MF3/22]